MKSLLYAGLAGAVIGALAIYYLFPRVETQIKVETRTVTEYKTRIVERWTKDPNGSITHDRTEETSGTTDSNTAFSKTIAKPNWIVGAQLGLQVDSAGPKYGIRVERRILGPIFAGFYGTNNKEAGISLGMEF